MTIESESEISSTGSGSTVGVTVRESGGGPGTNLRKADIYLHIEPGVVEPKQIRGNPSDPNLVCVFDPSGIHVWWKDVEFSKNGPKKVKLQLKRKSRMKPSASSRMHVLVAFRALQKLHVHHGWIPGKGTQRSIVS